MAGTTGAARCKGAGALAADGAAAGAAAVLGAVARAGADGGGAAARIGATLGAPVGPPGGSVGNLMVGAAVGLGGKLMRTVSFLGCTLPVSFLGGGTAPVGPGGGVGGGISAIVHLQDNRRTAAVKCNSGGATKKTDAATLCPIRGRCSDLRST